MKRIDGLFYGMHDGEESLALGESKIQKRRSDALRNSLDSINRFHDPTGDTKTRHELTVAADNLSSNLSEPELDKLRNLLKEGEKSYKQVHPIFAAYDESWILDVQADAQDEDEIRELICEKIDNSGVNEYIFDKLEEDEYKKLKKYELIFFLLPLEDADSFREQLQHELYPYINS
ncbi:Hachiman antiphage defense system protein HamA [Halostagnicola sp. A56]|uniref:Hachiman antiphage defense system protein HamA n=1 Tax=Halostagnicola sp. A56 TaxID=1495067 RepID=UPI000678DA5F|nr:Hachiman antiphage defense system protein HamA [Halostagnicola sp. A56]